MTLEGKASGPCAALGHIRHPDHRNGPARSSRSEHSESRAGETGRTERSINAGGNRALSGDAAQSRVAGERR